MLYLPTTLSRFPRRNKTQKKLHTGLKPRRVDKSSAFGQKPHCCLWKWPHRKEYQFIRRRHPCASKSASQAVLTRMHSSPFMRLAETLHGASRLVLMMSAWLVKSRRAPSRRRRDARAYGHTTTAMHDNEYIPPRPSFKINTPEPNTKIMMPTSKSEKWRYYTVILWC